MLVERNGHIVPYQTLYKKAICSEQCFAESYEKTLLIHEYRRRIEKGLGIFEKPPEGEPPLSETDESILNDKKFRRSVFTFIRRSKKASIAQVKQHVKSKYTMSTLQYLFDWCVENNLLFTEEVVHQNKQKTCYYYIR